MQVIQQLARALIAEAQRSTRRSHASRLVRVLRRDEPIPYDALPTRLHTLRAVERWHVARVTSDSYTYTEAARRLGVTPKTLWALLRRHGIDDARPHTDPP